MKKRTVIKKFKIPSHYQSSIVGKVKDERNAKDPLKKDPSPSILDFGPVVFYLARHFGFCYGVENAIEISYKALEENPGKNVYLLSQMIHNPMVNDDLAKRGIKFIMDTMGNQFIPWQDLNHDDVVIIPAFGTTLEIEEKLKSIGIRIETYNTTCPFVEKVWTRSEKLGKQDYTVIIHGKAKHEETRATFSHSQKYAASLIIRDLDEARTLKGFITGERPSQEFYEIFKGRYSEGFDVSKDLQRIGVVNQTTMLATDTLEISEYLKSVMQGLYGDAHKDHFADTRDTLCYATNDNQRATYELLKQPADFALVVGGYNSSNTSHIVELLESKFTTYFINHANEISLDKSIKHFNVHQCRLEETNNFIPGKDKVEIVLTSGASCPDVLLDQVIYKMLKFFKTSLNPELVLAGHSTQ